MEKQTFTGRTVDDALNQASKVLGTEKQALSYNILPQEGGLFSKLFSRGVKVEVWLENSQDLQAAAREAVKQALEFKAGSHSEKPGFVERQKPAKTYPSKVADSAAKTESPVKEQVRGYAKQVKPFAPVGEVKDLKVRKVPRRNLDPKIADEKVGNEDQLQAPTMRRERVRENVVTMNNPGLFELLNTFSVHFGQGFGAEDKVPSVNQGEAGETWVKIDDSFLEELLSKSDKLSGAFEHVFKRIVQKKFGDLEGRIFLDAGNAREIRKDRLQGIAVSLAEKVKKTGKSVSLASKSAQERRIVHLSLDGFVGVATRSVGSGDNRKLIIYPTGKLKKPKKGPKPAPSKAGNGLEAGENAKPKFVASAQKFQGNAQGRVENSMDANSSEEPRVRRRKRGKRNGMHPTRRDPAPSAGGEAGHQSGQPSVNEVKTSSVSSREQRLESIPNKG
jgi:spoIIIJ-associated protein